MSKAMSIEMAAKLVACKNNNTAADIGGLDEFEEIIGDGEVPF